LNFFWHSWNLDFLHNCECTHKYLVHINILLYYGLLEEWTTWWVVYFFLANYHKGFFILLGLAIAPNMIVCGKFLNSCPTSPQSGQVRTNGYTKYDHLIGYLHGCPITFTWWKFCNPFIDILNGTICGYLLLMKLLQMVTQSPLLLVIAGTFIKSLARYCQLQPKLHSCLNHQIPLLLFIHTNIHPMKCFKSF
jgi:hypothetical protein